MKKYFLSLVAIAAAMLFATSCQESLVEPQLGGPTTFTIEVPTQMETKADFGSAENVNQLLVEVYQVGTNKVIYQTVKSINGSTKVELNLIQGQMYDILFWAQKENEYVQVDADGAFSSLKSIELNSRNLNNDNGAAFFHAEKEFDDLGTSPTIYLRRPFAQLNLGTTDKSLEPMTGKVTLTSSLITVKGVATHFNVYEGVGYGNQNVEWVFGPEVSPKEPVEVPKQALKIGKEPNVQTFVYVSMNYLAVLGDTKAVVDVDAKIIVNDPAISGSRTIEHSFTSVPVQENYRTNIVGNLISSTTDFNVVVDDRFVDENGDNVSDDYNMLIWDGESIKVPSYDETTSTYSISNGAELAWLAATVSGDPLTRSGNAPNSLAGKTIKLTEDIYLADNEWKPIGMGGKHFEGIFDGQGHTIYGLKVVSSYTGNQAALFCSAAGSAQFKNFTIDGANIIYPQNGEDYYAAAVVGTIYGDITFKNITVKNSRITGNNKVAGLFAHDGSSNQITIDNCHILDSYIASEDLNDGGCVGGMIGYYATGKAGKENNISNSSVKGCTIVGVNSSNSGKRANSEFIGSILTEDAMVLNITNCILERNMFTQTINGTDPVTYQSAFIPQYIGGDRQEQTKGKINITFDGKNVIADGVAQDAEGNYYISNAAGLRWVADNVNTMEYYVSGSANIFDEKTVYLTSDIDLKGEEWRPIGDYAFSRTSFNGVFDGQNHTISNFKVTQKVAWEQKQNEASYGFFGNVKGRIMNVKVKNATVNPEGGAYSGVLVGRLHNGGSIENCHVENSSVTINHWQVGGILGQNNNGNISGCSVVGSTITGKAAVGAIVGMDMAIGEHTISGCLVKNTALVQNASFGSDYDASYGLAVGLVNASGITLHLNEIDVENNTIKGVEDNTLVGDKESGAIIYVDGAVPVSTAEELTAAIKAGGSYIMMNDIAMTEAIYQNIDFTLNGNGYTISQAVGSTNNYALFDSVTGKITLKNVNFAGIKGGAVLRTIGGAETTIENVTIQGAETTQQQGLLRLVGKNTIKNSTFKNNTCNMVISLNYDGENNDPQVVENCVFESNTCNATAVLYYVKGAGATINGNRFIGNTVNCNNNGATVYMGFTENNTVTNNLFQGNTVNEAGESSRVGGAIFFGYETVFTGNAFVGNKVTGTNVKGNDVCVSTYYTSIDLSGNYWGGNAPEENTNYFVQHKSDERVVIIDNYLTENPIK